jgi:hypothetical protein
MSTDPATRALPPPPAAVTEYFQRRRHTLSGFTPEDLLHNERLWQVEICGLPEETFNPEPIVTRDQALQLDDPFADKREFGPNGQYANCEHCRAVFESLGLRLCSACSKSSRGVRVRCCEECGASLPPTGRKSLRFCSDACRQKAQRRDPSVTDFVTLTRGGVPRISDTPVSVTALQAEQGFPDPKIRNALPPTRCSTCKRSLQPVRKDAKFCSDACRQRAYRQRRTRRRAHFAEAAE